MIVVSLVDVNWTTAVLLLAVVDDEVLLLRLGMGVVELVRIGVVACVIGVVVIELIVVLVLVEMTEGAGGAVHVKVDVAACSTTAVLDDTAVVLDDSTAVLLLTVVDAEDVLLLEVA